MALRLDSNRVVQRAPPQDLWQPHVKSEPVLQEMPEAFGSKTTLSFKERYIGISQSRLRAPGTRHVGNNRGGGGGTPNFDTPLRISCEFLESIGSGSVFCPRRDVIKGERYSGASASAVAGRNDFCGLDAPSGQQKQWKHLAAIQTSAESKHTAKSSHAATSPSFVIVRRQRWRVPRPRLKIRNPKIHQVAFRD